MGEMAIEVRGISKRYVIGGLEPGARSVAAALSAPLRRLRVLRGDRGETFWALKDVSFQVPRGTVLGIVGANGAGKSTLLKILSRITHPSEGDFRYRGRLATLLEVGTGFHPELSGRENVFLNGAILGMTRREVRSRLEAIVDFAGVERFLDTPVKRYSSGMYVRLAFAVAAHLDPDILVVDEVLSVGDAAFQKKCVNRMSEVSGSGRTVLFVSHNLDAVQRLCSEALHLEAGRLVFRGPAHEAVARYLEGGGRRGAAADLATVQPRRGTGRARIRGFEVHDAHGVRAATLACGGDYRFVLHYESDDGGDEVSDMMVSLELADARGTTVWMVASDFSGDVFPVARGGGSVECRVQDLALAPGDYTLSLYLGRRPGETFDSLDNVLTLTVAGGDFFGSGHAGLPQRCATLTRAQWRGC